MRLDDVGESTNVEDRRGDGGGGFGGGFGFPMRSGGLGFGTMIVLSLVAWAFGISPSILIGGAEMLSNVTGGSRTEQVSAPRPAGAKPDADQQFVARVLKSTEDVFTEQLAKQLNIKYQKPNLVMFSNFTRSGCGGAQSAMGPFYCPLDSKVYLDTAFFGEMKTRLRAGGDFAYAYVIAHEVGHHVENQLGILPKVQEMQQRVGRKESNNLSVRVELMADCLAGVWAHHAEQKFRILEQGDIEEALNAASQIGDDKLQKASQGYAVPDSFTHGSSQQRMEWFTRGLKTGQIRACDTFNARSGV
ncbi:MAG TPA: neutral zinc metallopeptidase [Beijerinckiaceae bacterium]|nr:neutral zinc metallopeptidase [Beijerinckiaceae bacterium]